MSPNPGFAITKRDGIIDVNEDSLARDVSIITAFPRPPGETFFHVDDILQITPGCKILFSTEAENNPAYFRQRSAELFKSRQILAKLHPGSPQYQQLSDEIFRISQHLVDYYQGRKRVKAERVVSYVDRNRQLIGVTEPFTYGYKPRVFGTVTRVLGFALNSVDEPGTDRLHKEAKKIYGNDWESEWLETKQFPDLK